MRADFRADAIFERRNNFAAGGVVFGIRGEYESDIKRQADGITLNLHVAFLHDVEKADLNFSGKIGQFIDRKNAAISARQKTIMHGQFAGQFMAAASCFDGINIANQIGNGHIWRGQFLDVTLLGREISNCRAVSAFGNQFLAAAANRRIRIVVDFASGDVRHMRIEQRRQRTKDAALGLPTKSKQDEVMPRQNCIDDLRDDSVVIAYDAGENRRLFIFIRAKAGNQVFT